MLLPSSSPSASSISSSSLQSGDPTSAVGMPSDSAAEAHLVIWGTDVNVHETKKRFLSFLRDFVDDMPAEEEEGGDSPMDGSGPLYLQRLEEV